MSLLACVSISLAHSTIFSSQLCVLVFSIHKKKSWLFFHSFNYTHTSYSQQVMGLLMIIGRGWCLLSLCAAQFILFYVYSFLLCLLLKLYRLNVTSISWNNVVSCWMFSFWLRVAGFLVYSGEYICHTNDNSWGITLKLVPRSFSFKSLNWCHFFMLTVYKSHFWLDVINKWPKVQKNSIILSHLENYYINPKISPTMKTNSQKLF